MTRYKVYHEEADVERGLTYGDFSYTGYSLLEAHRAYNAAVWAMEHGEYERVPLVAAEDPGDDVIRFDLFRDKRDGRVVGVFLLKEEAPDY